MSQCVCAGAFVKCSFGTIPTPLNVLPQKRVNVSKRPAATILDCKPFLNIIPFGICNSPSHPVFMATGAPGPCFVPIASPSWIVGAPTVLTGKIPTLNSTGKAICSLGGVINFIFAGQMTTAVP